MNTLVNNFIIAMLCSVAAFCAEPTREEIIADLKEKNPAITINGVTYRSGDAAYEEELALRADGLQDAQVERAASASRKIWPSAGAFWQEFTLQEKAAILGSSDATIKLIMEELRMWRGAVWSDDPLGGGRVMMGLNALVAAGVITEQRKAAILSKD